jgi:hypothetical protein
VIVRGSCVHSPLERQRATLVDTKLVGVPSDQVSSYISADIGAYLEADKPSSTVIYILSSFFVVCLVYTQALLCVLTLASVEMLVYLLRLLA